MPRIAAPTAEMIDQAVRDLARGAVVAFPTETVYGLGGDTFNPAALDLIYEMKGRPPDNPLIAHVLDREQAQGLVMGWDAVCDRLAKRFWPGPLTLVLPKAGGVPARATAGRPTIAVRSPAHPVARKLLQAFGGPISAPSANRSGRVSPTTAEHVATDFADVDELLILDGGSSEVGIESTVLDLSGARARILRPGAVTIEQLREILGDIEGREITSQDAGPGTSAAHYAPRTPAEIVDSSQLQARLRQLDGLAVVLGFDSAAGAVFAPHRAIVMPRDAQAYANRLYAALREADAMGCAMILIERPPPPPQELGQGAARDQDALWLAVHDRLRRATAKR